MRRTARLFRAAALAALAGAGGPALAQDIDPAGLRQACPPAACPPVACPPVVAPVPAAPGAPTTTLTAPPGPETFADAAPSFAGTLSGAGIGTTTAVNPGGYIDGAIPVTQLRLRYDFAYRNNRPDRAEFFYPKCGCFFPPPFNQLDANGPPLPETRVDYQEFITTLEYAVSPRFSVFADVPIRAINPTNNANATGLGDVGFGFKYALVLTDCRAVTVQLRTIAPSGDGDKGLGTENWWVTPGILWQEQATDRLTFFGEVQDYIPVAPNSNFAGNVLRYGLGTAYLAATTPRVRVLPVAEFVGWSVLSGRELNPDIGLDQSASGATIVNAKVGVRFGFGEVCDPGALGRHDLYLGYGRAMTGEVWYKDLFRVEYRLRF